MPYPARFTRYRYSLSFPYCPLFTTPPQLPKPPAPSLPFPPVHLSLSIEPPSKGNKRTLSLSVLRRIVWIEGGGGRLLSCVDVKFTSLSYLVPNRYQSPGQPILAHPILSYPLQPTQPCIVHTQRERENKCIIQSSITACLQTTKHD